MPYNYDGNVWSSSSSSSSDDESIVTTALQTHLRLYLSGRFLARPTSTITVIPPNGTPALLVFTATGRLEERTIVLVECYERRFPLDDAAISNPAFRLTALMPTLAKLEFSIEKWSRARAGVSFGAWKAVVACKDANGAILSVGGERPRHIANLRISTAIVMCTTSEVGGFL